VFLGPVEIAGHYAGLESALHSIGVDAVAVDLSAHPFRYRRRTAPDPIAVRLARWAWTRARDARSRPRRLALLAAKGVTSVVLMCWAILRFDTFVFGFGYTFLGTRELPLLRRLGKRLVFVFHGSDARPPYIDGFLMSPERGRSAAECVALTRRTKVRLRRIERFAHVIVAQPTFSHLFERPVVNFFALGVLWQASEARPVSGGTGGSVRILHSPSDPIVKGTARIRAVVNELRAEGLPLELVELQGVPNDVVRRELQGCDFAIDQIYSDAPMVGFATEAAVAGKPSIVGGYAWPENHRLHGDANIPPVEETVPEHLATAIRRLAGDALHRAELGERARRFVLEHWAPEQVGRRYERRLEGSPPTAWLFDPRQL